jgi:hypothetical protein
MMLDLLWLLLSPVWNINCRIFINFIHQWPHSPLLGCGRLFSFEIILTQSVGPLGKRISPSQCHYMRTGQHKQINARRHPCLWVGFESTIPAFERAKTVHASDRLATVNCRTLSTDNFHTFWSLKEVRPNSHRICRCSAEVHRTKHLSTG